MTRWSVHFIWATLVILIVVFSRAESSPAPADTDSPRAKVEVPDRIKIALVDIALVFKSVNSFTEQMKKMKSKVDAAEVKIKVQQEELKQLAERAKDESTPEEEKVSLERRVTERQAILTSEIAIQKQQFMREEGLIYFEMSSAIDRHIAEFSKQHGLDLVMRVSTETVNRNDRTDILRGINKPICYYEPKLDITAEIIQALNAD